MEIWKIILKEVIPVVTFIHVHLPVNFYIVCNSCNYNSHKTFFNHRLSDTHRIVLTDFSYR